MATKRIPTVTPQQSDFLNQLLSLLQGQGLGGGGSALQYYMGLLQGSPESYAKFEEPLKRQFNEEIIPGLAERFSGAGAGAQHSSAFQQSLGRAGSDLESRLAALRGQLQMQGAQGLLGGLQGLGGLGLGTQTFGYVNQPRAPSFLQSLFGGLGSLGGMGLGSFGSTLGAGYGNSFLQKLGILQ